MVSANFKRYCRPGTPSEVCVIPLVKSVVGVADTSLWECPVDKSAETLRLQPMSNVNCYQKYEPRQGPFALCGCLTSGLAVHPPGISRPADEKSRSCCTRLADTKSLRSVFEQLARRFSIDILKCHPAPMSPRGLIVAFCHPSAVGSVTLQTTSVFGHTSVKLKSGAVI